MNKSRYQRSSVRLLSVLRSAGLLVALTLVIGAATRTAPAQAAPAGQGSAAFELHLKYSIPKELCAGQDYYITVTPLVDMDGTREDGGTIRYTDRLLTGVRISAYVGDERIAIITPASKTSTYRDSKDFMPITSSRYRPRLGAVTFTLHTGQPGSTDLFIEATVPARFEQGGQMFGSSEPIQVVNCKYKVTMNATDIDAGGGVTIWTTGDLSTEITGDGGELKGTGNFAFVSGFAGGDCSISYTDFNNPTTITGQVGDSGQLTLQFSYEPGQITSNASCPDGGGSTTQEIDLTNTGITSATFPEEGGTRMFRFTYAGSDMAPGTMTINVEPVTEDAGH